MRHMCFRSPSKTLLALGAAAVALSACGSSGSSTAAKSTATTSAGTKAAAGTKASGPPSTLGTTAPSPPTTAAGQLPTTASTPKVASSGKPPCDVSEKFVSGHLAVTVLVPGPALVQVKATDADPQVENAIVNQGSGGVVVYMNTTRGDNAQVTIAKNRQFATCSAPAPTS